MLSRVPGLRTVTGLNMDLQNGFMTEPGLEKVLNVLAVDWSDFLVFLLPTSNYVSLFLSSSYP